MSNNLSDMKNKEKEDDKIEINKEEKEINNLIEKDKISKLLMNKEKREKSRKKTSKKKKGMSDERIINIETLIPPECTKVPFIPEKTDNKQKTLVIDLDETLVHSYFAKEPPYTPDISYDIEITGITIHISTLIRPGTYQFLERLSKIYEIVIFTASLSQYAIPLLNEIDKNNYCKYKLFREHCYIFDNKGNPGYVKDLSKLNRDLNNVIIIDNNPDCYFLNKENGIPIKTWLNDKNDKELLKLLPYLEFLANEYIIDVRPILTKIKDGKTINFKIFDEIIENYKKTNKEINNKSDNNNTVNENNSKTIESSNIINNNKHNEGEKENENNNILKEEDILLNNNSKNLDNIEKMKINETNKNYYQDKDILINDYEIRNIKVNEDLKKSEKELKEENLNINKERDNNIRCNTEKVKSKEYKEKMNKTDSVSKKKKSIKNSIINSLEKNHKKIFLKINEDRKLLNNIKCENIFQKNIQTIINENIFNRHRNIKTNDIDTNLYKNKIFDEKLKLNTNENQTLFSNESKSNSLVPFKLNEKKDNFLKVKLKEFDFKIKHFNIKIKNKEIDNYELKKNKFKNFNELNLKDVKKQIINKEYNLGICFSDLLGNKNKENIKEKSNKTDSTIKKDDKNSKDIFFYKSKTMYNLSNKKGIDLDDKNSDAKKAEIKIKKRKNLSFFKKEINRDFYLPSNENKIKNKNNIININTKINIKKTNRKISEMDNIIYFKRFNSNKKESDKISLIKKFVSKNMNIKKKLHLKLPITKRINIYSKFAKDFYNKDKIISFMNKINKKISNKEKNNNNRNNIINLQGLEQIKRLNFFNEKKRQGLSVGNVNNPTPLIFKIRPSYSAIE